MKRTFFGQSGLMISYLLVLFLAATEAPLWISCFAAVLLVWKWFSEKKSLPKFPRKLTAALSILMVVQVYLQYRTLLGQEASNTLLVGLSALKIMDYESERDHKFLILLGFIMVAMKAVFSVDILWILPSGVAFAGLWYSLLDPEMQRRSRSLIRLFAASTPLAILLFLAFPRLVVPWAMSRASAVGTVGFSDRMNPGSVAELAAVDTLAFRAKFFGRAQSLENLYWRGVVLTESEGLQWVRPRNQGRTSPRLKSPNGFRYEVIVEPGTRGYLFTLSYPKSVISDSIQFTELKFAVFRSFQNLTKPLTYQVTSDDTLFDAEVPNEELTEIPDLPPETRAWVEAILKRETSPEGRLKELRRFFEDPAFAYTMRPGFYASNDLDEFLFHRKRGFCEHFAGAYATLARALGLPSRVVVGYHGGVFNLIGDFWRVSQKDAHAWVEVFVNGRWEQVDPTEWIAPLRLNMGAEGFFNLSEQQRAQYARTPRWGLAGEPKFSVLEALSFWADDLNYRWTYFVLDFDLDQQRSFWAGLTRDLGVFLVIAIVTLLAGLLGVRKLLRGKERRTPLEKLMDRVIRWGEQRGVLYGNSETPLSYLTRLAGKFPLQSKALESIGRAYDLRMYREEELSPEALSLPRKLWDEVKNKKAGGVVSSQGSLRKGGE
ncbi:MAG TPA: DUF3488 and transglutaminase-like domain-containing protein [Pseudobdellovibrionaceae bacterium]|nr:DUF3488 and transglutaminase-like domain-containing protein [Pseudobdellovibrionaceae bacterium]